jgi:hypothetical protein
VTVNSYTKNKPRTPIPRAVRQDNPTRQNHLPHPPVEKECLRCGKKFITDLDKPNRDYCRECLYGQPINYI